MEASGQWLRWRPPRCVERWRRTTSSSREIRAMRSCTRRRSVSSCDSPSPPRMPMPPVWRDKWPQNRVRRGSKCCNCASSICILPSRVRARCAKMSRISDVRSRILQLKIFSRLRLCAGESSSSKMTVSTSLRRQNPGKFLRLAFADERGGDGRFHFLHAVADDFAAGGRGQFAKFGQ